MMALIIGSITLAIYSRNRSLSMLTVLGIYEIAIFSALLSQKYIAAQYQTAEFIAVIAAASAFVIMILKLVKE